MMGTAEERATRARWVAAYKMAADAREKAARAEGYAEGQKGGVLLLLLAIGEIGATLRHIARALDPVAWQMGRGDGLPLRAVVEELVEHARGEWVRTKA